MCDSVIGRSHKLNRKTKRQMTTVVVLLFFLAAGVWYYSTCNEAGKKQETNMALTGVWNAEKAEVSAAPAVAEQEWKAEIVVYVCGAVNAPGIYTLAADSRLYEAVTLAGGFSAEADPAYHNLARSLADGERIYILSEKETKELTTEQQVSGEEGTAGTFPEKDALINLNTASAEKLMELPGIGEAKAAGILEYRARIGQFTAIEEIMNVSGIGEAMFEKIKDKITVK